MIVDQNNPNPKNGQIPTTHLKVMQNIKTSKFLCVVEDFKLNVLVKQRLGWKLEHSHHWKFEISIFKQFLNLQVFGDLDLNYVFHLYSRFVGG